MTRENTELAKAIERVDGFARRWEARIGCGAQTSDLIYAVTVQGFDGDAELRASDLRLILSALSAHEGEGEPVAWRWQFDHGGLSNWYYGTDKPDGFRFGNPENVEPLYAAPPPSVEVERLREALERFLRWGQQQCPCYNDEPNPCPLCGASIENLEGCKAIEAKFPRDILTQARAALSRKQEPGVPTPGGEG